MKVVDANVLLYAVNEDAPHHAPAKGWLDGALGRAETVGFDWVVLLAFLRLSTRAGLFSRPLTTAEAVGVVESWLAQPASIVLQPTLRHLHLLQGLLSEVGTAANLVNDAHVAALALEHGAEVVSFDTDFSRFEGVRWRRPGE
ncbi:MAG TPA: type II toxin-antitoxin system VapC family toxin [Acidimicrobiales bacterium]|nr:type II toxin-antitoxin system VapC family toxin [Acidimicrobiales bacterium]